MNPLVLRKLISISDFGNILLLVTCRAKTATSMTFTVQLRITYYFQEVTFIFAFFIYIDLEFMALLY
jgi:hypothetical protein